MAGSPPRGPRPDAPLLHQTSDDLSLRADGRRNGSLDVRAAGRQASSQHSTHSGGGYYHSFTQGQRPVCGGEYMNPFQVHAAWELTAQCMQQTCVHHESISRPLEQCAAPSTSPGDAAGEHHLSTLVQQVTCPFLS